MKEIKKFIEKPLQDMGLRVDDITYENKTLSIVLDSDNVIDIDTIVKATKIISPIIDEKDFIKESNVLDVSSKEKGEK